MWIREWLYSCKSHIFLQTLHKALWNETDTGMKMATFLIQLFWSLLVPIFLNSYRISVSKFTRRAIATQLLVEINPCPQVPVSSGSDFMSGSQMMTTSSRDVSSHQILKCAAKLKSFVFWQPGTGCPHTVLRAKKKLEILQEFPI